MFETRIVPYSFTTDVVPTVQSQQALPGMAQGVYITLHPDVLDDLSERMQRWFEGRSEIVIVDVGISDKQGLGFMILEWMECAIDPLFLAILRDAEMIGDYTTYGRSLEGEGYGR